MFYDAPWLSQTKSLAAPILFNKLNSRLFERHLDCGDCILGNPPSFSFKIDDCGEAQSGGVGEVGLAQFQQRTRGTGLGRCHRSTIIVDAAMTWEYQQILLMQRAAARRERSMVTVKHNVPEFSAQAGLSGRLRRPDHHGRRQAALQRLWREKRGEAEPEDLSGNLIVQLGLVTEDLNRRWYEANTGQAIKDVQRRVQHPVLRWMAATLDGLVEGTGAVFEAKFMLPWSFSEEAAAEKYMPQLQHNMWVTNARASVLSIITGGGKWVEIAISADPLYQHLLLTAEKKFWRCVETGEPPRLFGVEPPRPRIEAVRIVDMSSSNAWAEFAAAFRRTRPAYLEHETAKAELKGLMPEDAKEATGHGIRAKRSKSGAVSFDVLAMEAGHAPGQ